MLQKLFDFLLGRRKTVSSAVLVFSKTLDDLEKIEARHKQEAQDHADLAQRALNKASDHSQEADRAHRIGAKISAIIDHDDLHAVPAL